jgi:glutamine amidotransferase
MKCVVIDYGSGNLRSVAKSLEKVAASQKIEVSSDPAALASATHIVLPGVGAFADCIKGLTDISGMVEALEHEVHKNKKPFLGICVGMQMLFERGLEHGAHKGLGWLEGEVVKIDADASFKIPHMGWNELNILQPTHSLLKNIHTGEHVYFVHSYHARCKNLSDVIAATDYGSALTAIVAKDNIMGVQFHPEKSQAAGLQLLNNFLGMNEA